MHEPSAEQAFHIKTKGCRTLITQKYRNTLATIVSEHIRFFAPLLVISHESSLKQNTIAEVLGKKDTGFYGELEKG